MRPNGAMRLTAGLGYADQLPIYADAGADELFFGYVPEKWMRRWGLLLPLNRRESRYVNVQAGGLNEIRILKKQAEDLGVSLSVTMNALYYIPDQLPAAEELVLRLRDEGLDTLIVGDMGLLWYLDSRGALDGAHIHLSGEAGEVNRGMLPMLKKAHVERVIFHRKTSHEDRKGLIAFSHRHPECAVGEFEAFAMNELCHYTGAYCAGVHMEEWPPLCRAEWIIAPAERSTGRGRYFRPLPAACAQDAACALCGLPRLKEEGITHLKLAGRGARTPDMARKIALARKAVRLCAVAADEADYLKELRALLGGKECGACYYPEWGFLKGFPAPASGRGPREA